MFEVAGEAYDRFMGRYSRGLSAQLADLAQVGPAMRVLDVGCGPGALVGELVSRLGPDLVTAVDPSEPFVGLRVRCSAALPTEPFTITARAWAARGWRRGRHR